MNPLGRGISGDNRGRYRVKTHGLVNGTAQMRQSGDCIKIERVDVGELGLNFLRVLRMLGEAVEQEC